MAIPNPTNNGVVNYLNDTLPKVSVSTSAPVASPVFPQPISSTVGSPVGVLAPKKPTTVVSSQTASNTAQNIKTNVIAPYDQAVNAGNLTQSEADARDATATNDMKFLPGSGNPNPNYTAPATTPTPPPTLDQAQTDAALHPNQTQLYNLSNGQQEWVDDSKVSNGTATGYSATNPTQMGSTATVAGSNGETYKQFPDGTYGMFDAAGNYVTAANSAQFQSAKNVQDTTTALNNAKAGIYDPAQQSQIDGITSDYQAAMDKQANVNANLTGATTLAENLAGMGNQITGQQIIAKTVSDGIAAITALTNQRNSAISQMKTAFQNDDTTALKDAYDIYNTSSTNIQKNLDKIQSDIQTAKNKQQASDESFATTMAGKYDDTDTPIDPYNDDKNAVLQKLLTSPKYQSDHAVAASLTPDESNFMGQLATSGVSLSNMFPSLGIGTAAASLKIGILKSMIDNATKAGLSAQDVANSMLDKQAKAKTYAKLQTQGSLLASQETKVESDFDLVKSLGTKVGDASIQGAAPLLQNWINTGTLATTNNPELNNWLGALTTSMTNYARVVYGQTGGAGVASGANTEVQNLLKKGLSVSTVNDYIDNVAKPEMKNTISGYDTNMKQLMDDMNNADGTVNAGGGLGATNTNTPTGSIPDNGRAF